MQDRDPLWNELFDAARIEGGLDPDSYLLAHTAIIDRDTNSAREILEVAATHLAANTPIPRLIALYLAQALREIAAGKDPAQSLHLKANARKRTDRIQLLQMYYGVEWHKANGATSEADALRMVAGRLGLKKGAAEKRYALAKEKIGPFFDEFNNTMRAVGAKKGAQVPSLGHALAGGGYTNAADEVIAKMIKVIGAPPEVWKK